MAGEDSLINDVVKSVVGAALPALLTNYLGQRTIAKPESDGKTDGKTVNSIRAISLLIGIAIFLLVWKFTRKDDGPDKAAVNVPVLQSVMAKPNLVKKGGRVTVTVQLDRPAPKGGVSVVLTSSDPAILTVDGNATVPAGRTMGTGYSQVVDVPTYASPVAIIASLNDATVQTDVNVTKSDPVPALTPYPGVPRPINPAPARPPSQNQSVASQQPSAPPPLPAELVGRFEDAEARLASEKSFWEGTKQHMPAGTSLRPEITSQIFAAESSSQRCAKAKQASDAAALTACVDALNDHLTQLKIQH